MSEQEKTANPQAEEGPRVLLVDDHSLFRQSLRSGLEQHDVNVVGEADSGTEALRQLTALAPDVVIMDLKMPGISGAETTRQMTANAPAIRILVLTTSDMEEDVVEAILAGACGYLTKGTSIEELLAGITAAAAGESMISPAIAAQILTRLRETSDAVEQTPGRTPLSRREMEVLQLVAHGADNSEIASRLGISPKTVKNHVSNILMKLQMGSRVEAAVYAARSGLLWTNGFGLFRTRRQRK